MASCKNNYGCGVGISGTVLGELVGEAMPVLHGRLLSGPRPVKELGLRECVVCKDPGASTDVANAANTRYICSLNGHN